MYSYTFNFVGTYAAGTNQYYSPRARGTIDVWHDNKRHVYKKLNFDVPQSIVKNDILAAWDEAHGTTHRMTGVYPSYKIQVK